MNTYTLDTNCFIDAIDPQSHGYEAMKMILNSEKAKLIKLTVSRHTLHEIPKQTHVVNIQDAIELAKTIEILPNYPVGSWEDQVGSWNNAAGSWDDTRINQQRQEDLQKN